MNPRNDIEVFVEIDDITIQSNCGSSDIVLSNYICRVQYVGAIPQMSWSQVFWNSCCRVVPIQAFPWRDGRPWDLQ